MERNATLHFPPRCLLVLLAIDSVYSRATSQFIFISVENNEVYKFNYLCFFNAPSRRKYIGSSLNRQQSYSKEL